MSFCLWECFCRSCCIHTPTEIIAATKISEILDLHHSYFSFYTTSFFFPFFRRLAISALYQLKKQNGTKMQRYVLMCGHVLKLVITCTKIGD